MWTTPALSQRPVTTCPGEDVRSTLHERRLANRTPFDIADTASQDVVSLDTMRFDFGGGAVVSLTTSACEGSSPISAGGQQAVETQVVVHADGTVQPADFSIPCPDHQSFGGAKGTGTDRLDVRRSHRDHHRRQDGGRCVHRHEQRHTKPLKNQRDRRSPALAQFA
jgi:hypothetical protein